MDPNPKFVKELLSTLKINDLKIIGQSSEKAVIFCFHSKRRRILCFDQHAVDERIRYERILSSPGQKFKSDEAKSLACHGAIRFGDRLTNSQCYDLIERVLKCRSPYRCAHLRPSVCVLDSLDKIYFIEMIRNNSPNVLTTEISSESYSLTKQLSYHPRPKEMFQDAMHKDIEDTI